ncbi:hypothetical protein V6Z92_007313 [Aspergillus fumigatus]
MKLSRFSTPRLQSRCEAMEEGYRLFLSSLALLVDPILLAFLDYPPDVLSSLIPRASLSRLCPRRSPKEKKATHIFAPPHNSLVLCSLLVKSLPLRARQNRRELNGRKKARKRNYQHNPDSWLKTSLTITILASAPTASPSSPTVYHHNKNNNNNNNNNKKKKKKNHTRSSPCSRS